MDKGRKARTVGLVAAGVVVLAAAIYTTSAFATGTGPFAPRAAWAEGLAAVQAAAQTTSQNPAVTDSQLRDNILDMLKDHMGITGAEAEKLADQMLERCGRLNGDATAGRGTAPGAGRGPCGVGGNGSYRGPGMMNGAGSGGMMRGWGT